LIISAVFDSFWSLILSVKTKWKTPEKQILSPIK